MVILSPADRALLAAPLPDAGLLAARSDRFAGGEGVVEVRMAGAAHAPAMVLLHGIGSSADGYRAQLGGLRDGFRVVAWNAPGYGRSTPLEADTPEPADYAAVLHAMLAALGVARIAVLAGSSWGSIVAAAFAARHPGIVDALVLSAPNQGRRSVPIGAREAERAAMLRAGDGSVPVDRDAVADRLLAPGTAEDVRTHVRRLRDAVTPRGWRQAVAMLFGVHTPDLLPGLACPVTLVSGSLDTVAPASVHVAALRAVAPRAHTRVLAGCGHVPKLEAPSLFNAILRDAARPPT